MPPRPGRDNTAAWRKVKAIARARTNICALCGYLLNYDLPPRTPYSVEYDHIQPLALGGAPLDPNNVRPVHRRCHQRRPSVQALRKRTPRSSRIWTSRNW